MSARQGWTNWSGSERAVDVEVATPRDVAAVAAVLRRASAAGRGVRPVGSGHSFTGLATPRRPGDVLLRLDALDAPLEAVFRMELTPASVTVLSFFPDGRASMRLYNALPPARDSFVDGAW